MTDRTDYAWPKLSDVMQDVDGRDDLMSMGAAVLRADRVDFETWVAQSGPLPVGDERTELVEVFRRGLAEMRAFLQTNGRP